MKVLVVLCHPLKSSFNARIAETVCREVETTGHILLFHDLYRESFNPVLTEDELFRRYSLDEQVQRYMDEVTVADVLVFIHPDWWGQLPALLKGRLDRVLRPGVAYDYSGEEFLPKRFDRLLAGKRGIVYCTTDRAEQPAAQPLVAIWEEEIFGYCGVEGLCKVFHSMRDSSPLQRKVWLDTAAEDIAALLLT